MKSYIWIAKCIVNCVCNSWNAFSCIHNPQRWVYITQIVLCFVYCIENVWYTPSIVGKPQIEGETQLGLIRLDKI